MMSLKTHLKTNILTKRSAYFITLLAGDEVICGPATPGIPERTANPSLQVKEPGPAGSRGTAQCGRHVRLQATSGIHAEVCEQINQVFYIFIDRTFNNNNVIYL